MGDKDDSELLASLRRYLEELRESGVDELEYGEIAPVVAATEAVLEKAPAPCRIKQVGSARARVLFMRRGVELADASEELLARLIAAMKFAPEEVGIVSFDREPGASAEAVREALLDRIVSIAPEVVVALGEETAQILLKSSAPIAKMRGRFVELGDYQVMATLHPDQLVEDEGLKRQVWEEMKQVMGRFGKG